MKFSQTEIDLGGKGYKSSGAKVLTVIFDAKTKLDKGETLYVIDSEGRSISYSYEYSWSCTVKVDGEKAIFLINSNTKAKSYGYKVTKSAKKNGIITVSGVKTKKLTKATVPKKKKAAYKKLLKKGDYKGKVK